MKLTSIYLKKTTKKSQKKQVSSPKSIILTYSIEC